MRLVLVCLVLLVGCAGPSMPRLPGDLPAPTVSSAVTRLVSTPLVRPTAPGAVPAAPATRVDPGTTPTTAMPATPIPPSPSALAPMAGTPAPTLAGNLITRTMHLDIYRVEGGLLETTLLDLAPRFEEAIGRVGERMGAHLSGRVAISFEPPQRGACALRGITLSHARTIHLYYASDTPEQRLLPIVAHELVHQLQHDYYGWEAHRRSDTILLEGQATWASGDYALADGRPAWAVQAEQALAEGRLLPLTADLEADCRTTTRNTAYTGWASFVDFLISTYGRERFDALYRSSPKRAPGAADYAGIYGKDLNALDQAWRAWLKRGSGAR